MEQLQYKTRGNSDPRGKPRVYFCCHPRDHGAFFEQISDKILEKQNCAIWYLTDPYAQRTEALLSDLKQMQLFVMPVTYRLLSTSNPALDAEFRFAIENHIPVLPLMQEQGLEKLFNEKCGDLQFLDKHVQDATAIRYEEKLEKYLDSVLVGDKLAEKIRDAFDAYVFLSYRKKDRRYAQKLMRLIHKNDFCRDIAIWYDEFLTPGENFNDSIKAALEKSGLFVLAVTPNLVNETNYVMTTEYPMARTAKKPILPAELVATDKTRLEACYEGIPPCTNAHDDAALSEALLDAIKKMAIKENDGSSEHNFFIGLAYLSGVDVEVDHERAVRLITSAAEAGLVEAMDKLVSMYRTGLGVARNHETAIAWLERKICVLKTRHEEDREQRDWWKLYELFWAIRDCAEYYIELFQPQKALEKYEQGKLCTEGIHVPAIRSCFATSCEGIGRILCSQGDFSGAQQYLERALAVIEELAERKSDVLQSRRNLTVCYRELGGIAYAQGQLAQAGKYFEKSLALSIALEQAETQLLYQTDIAAAYQGLGEVAQAQSNFHDAQVWYEKLLEIGKKLEQEDSGILLAAYDKLGGLAADRKELGTARRYYEALTAKQEALLEKTDTPIVRNQLFYGYSTLAGIVGVQGDINTAEAFLKKGLSFCEDQLQEGGDLTLRINYAHAHDTLGRFAAEQGDMPRATEHHRQALSIRQALARETPTPQIRRGLAASYEALGGGAMLQEDFSSAAEYLREALVIWEKLASETENMDDKLQLFRCYTGRAASALGLGDRKLAKALSEKVISALEALQQDGENPKILSMLAEAYYVAGGASVLKRRRMWNQAISIYERLSRMYPDVKAYQRQLQILRQ